MSVVFNGGPANGQAMTLARAPRLLRVTVAITDKGPKFDALDQPGDIVFGDEEVYVYARKGETHQVHIRAQRGSGWHTLATYSYLDPQPQGVDLRSNEAWRAWCLKNDPMKKDQAT
jgi:hypothetical protein